MDLGRRQWRDGGGRRRKVSGNGESNEALGRQFYGTGMDVRK